MNTRLYWKNRIPFFLLNVLCMLALSFFLFATGSSPDTVLFIVLVWLLLLPLCTAVSCHLRRKELDRLLHITEQLKRRCLIADVMKQPARAEDQVYRQILRLSEKSMLEEIAGIERERTAYREYIEQWIHEIKTPITAMRLLCENNRTPFTKELLAQLEKTDRYTEQALYYARSEHTEKDFVVREITLCDVIHQAVTDNKYLLMQNHMTVDVEESGLTVFADEKWLRFILNQLIANAVKYRLDDSVQSASPALRFHMERRDGTVRLSLSDNGIGIPAGDLPRIFDKGFTGQNGRSRQGSTGLGLYLCRRLCDKLEIGLEVHSPADCVPGSGRLPFPDAPGTGTTIILSFYVNHFISQVQE